MDTLKAEPLDAASFAPFGHVLDLSAPSLTLLDELQNLRPGARARLSLATVEPIGLPLRVEEMERHAFSSQAFVPREVSRYLILVAPPGPTAPELSAIRAFIVPGTLGIIYRANTWHHPMRTLDRPGSFAVVTFVDGTQDDEEFRPVPRIFQVDD
ncbi:MAG TPA: ureidoglycolate lyase [Kaistia sp.]|nr:ureidoglycolate lyase [Kaistia sp.]